MVSAPSWSANPQQQTWPSEVNLGQDYSHYIETANEYSMPLYLTGSIGFQATITMSVVCSH